MLWEELISSEFNDKIEECGGVCVLPMGCLETHGYHLPLGCDAIHAAEICRRAAEKEKVCVFPTLYFGEKNGAGEFPGTVMFSTKLRHEILSETCSEIARNGFKKILLVKSHYGDSYMVGNFMYSLMEKKVDYLVYSCLMPLACPKGFLENYESGNKSAYPELSEKELDMVRSYAAKVKAEGHGGMSETAWVYSARPELCRLDRIPENDGKHKHVFDELERAGIASSFTWIADFPNSNSCEESFELTKPLADAITEYSVNELAKKFKILKEETASTEFYKGWLKSW